MTLPDVNMACCGCCQTGCLNNDRDSALQDEENRPLLGIADDNAQSGSHSNSPQSGRYSSLPHKDYESLDYDRCQNEVYNKMVDSCESQKFFYTRVEVVKWIVTFFIGFCTAMVALFIDVIVNQLSLLKFGTVNSSIEKCSSNAGCLVVSLLILLAFNVGFVFIASSLVVIEPVAAGSGIPEIKCYLNGISIPRVVRLRTLISKAVGVLFSVAGGLFVGKEGPMIHSGAVIGAGVPQFQSIACKKWMSLPYPFFRTDRDKRDFVSGGAAAGVAAAFGAPIGGVLFSLEEGSSFWNQKLTWRTFFCSMAATFSLNFFLSGINSNSWGYFYQPGLIDFGEFSNKDHRLWAAFDLFIFLAMGAVGGLLGAIFNSINKMLTKYRMRHVHPKWKGYRIIEAMLVAAVTSTVAFVAAMSMGECKNLQMINNETSADVRTYFCDHGQYNDMATLFFNGQEVAIKQLFHQPSAFSIRSLGIFFLFFFLLACWTYGISVPSGLFVPCLLCGAAYGRFVARFLEDVIGYKQSIYTGTYALIGAAAFLGGVVRMTISLTVILIESTNEISYGLPIMITLMVAKWFGDLFNEGLYDIHIELKSVPLLGWESPEGVHRLTAADIMDSKLKYIYPLSRVNAIVNLLSTTKHHAFPVVAVNTVEVSTTATNELPRRRFGSHISERSLQEELEEVELAESNNKMVHFKGLILRSQLVSLLKHKVYFSQDSLDTSGRKLTYAELMEDYPRFPDIQDIDQADIQHDMILDVWPYMNSSPYTVSPSTPVNQVFNLFRSMGLRHLPVIDSSGQIVGMITRHNLTEDFLEHACHAQQRGSEQDSPEHEGPLRGYQQI